jgi:type IX secretion system substrate protein
MPNTVKKKSTFGPGGWAASLLLGLLLSGGSPLPAQNGFEKTYGGGGIDYGYSVLQTEDGGYIVAGSTSSFGAGGLDVELIKTNTFGDTLWTQTYGGTSDEVGYSVQQTSDGGYIIAGTTWSFGSGNDDVYLLKTDSGGHLLWTRTFGGAGYEDGYFVRQTKDGGYIITGSTSSFGSGGYDVYLIKTNSLGDTLWTRTYGGGATDYAYSVVQTRDGGYLIAGATYSFGAGTSAQYLIRTNSAGDTLWTRTDKEYESAEACSLWETFDGGYIIAGQTWLNLCDTCDGTIRYDVYVTRTDSEGSQLWTRTFFGGDDFSLKSSVRQTSDGGYILAGSTGLWYLGYSAFLTRTNSHGDALWTQTYGGTGSRGRSAEQTTDGGFILAGASSGRLYLVKTDGDGVVTGVSADNTGNPPGEFRLKQNYPNPFNPSTTITFGLPAEQWISLKIYDLSGHEVATLAEGTQQAGYRTVEWNAATLSSGVYLYRLRAGSFTETRKLLLLK